MALTTSIGVITDVHDYLNRPSDERLKIFTETITDINHALAYWFDFPTIDKRMSDYEPDIYTLNYLNGKTNKEMREFFIVTLYRYFIRKDVTVYGSECKSS